MPILKKRFVTPRGLEWYLTHEMSTLENETLQFLGGIEKINDTNQTLGAFSTAKLRSSSVSLVAIIKDSLIANVGWNNSRRIRGIFAVENSSIRLVIRVYKHS